MVTSEYRVLEFIDNNFIKNKIFLKFKKIFYVFRIKGPSRYHVIKREGRGIVTIKILYTSKSLKNFYFIVDMIHKNMTLISCTLFSLIKQSRNLKSNKECSMGATPLREKLGVIF
jgi:hypothetical protein